MRDGGQAVTIMTRYGMQKPPVREQHHGHGPDQVGCVCAFLVCVFVCVCVCVRVRVCVHARAGGGEGDKSAVGRPAGNASLSDGEAP